MLLWFFSTFFTLEKRIPSSGISIQNPPLTHLWSSKCQLHQHGKPLLIYKWKEPHFWTLSCIHHPIPWILQRFKHFPFKQTHRLHARVPQMARPPTCTNQSYCNLISNIRDQMVTPRIDSAVAQLSSDAGFTMPRVGVRTRTLPLVSKTP